MIFTSQLQRLFDDFGRIFDDASWNWPQSQNHMPCNVWSNDQELIIQCELAGLDGTAVDLELEDQVLHISATYAEPESERTYLKGGPRAQTWKRSLKLPKGIDGSSASAEFKDGILQVRIKRSEPQRKTISVKVKK